MRFYFLLLIIAIVTTSCSSRLDSHRDLLVGRKASEAPAPKRNEVQITYLGTNGYLIRSHDTSIVVDPFFSRISLGKTLLNSPYSPSPSLISKYTKLAAFPSHIDAWLITHSHFDHLIDVPPLQKQFAGKIVTSQTGKFLCQAAAPEILPTDIFAARPGKRYRIGNATIHVMPSKHDRVLGQIPFPGLIFEALADPPKRPKDWKVGTPLAFLIEIAGKKIYVDSGGMLGHLPQANNVDLAILGVAVGDGQKRFAEAVRALNPRYIIPSHQDNFFIPLDRGFRFASTSNFPHVKEAYKTGQLPGELMLMDFFHSWILK
ncbi:MAG: MBL fold metallo-hydrolase [Verrucomicrobia bacterium]|nr:MBL fold metallo-hydrolase [Verrucomicrobiota bacterium]